MHIDGKQDGSIFSTARLELSVDNLAALGCEIRYYKYSVQISFVKICVLIRYVLD